MHPSQVPEPVTDTGVVVSVMLSLFALLGALWAGIGGRRHLAERRANKDFQRILREDWIGVPARPGVPERPGVMATLLNLRDDWAAISARVRKLELDSIAARSELTILHNRMEACERRVPLPDAESPLG